MLTFPISTVSPNPRRKRIIYRTFFPYRKWLLSLFAVLFRYISLGFPRPFRHFSESKKCSCITHTIFGRFITPNTDPRRSLSLTARNWEHNCANYNFTCPPTISTTETDGRLGRRTGDRGISTGDWELKKGGPPGKVTYTP